MRTFPPLYKKTTTGKTQLWTVAVRKNKDETGTIVVTQGQVDGKKQVYEEDIIEGKNLGKKNATTPFQQAVAEAESRWNKKKDRHHYGEDEAAEESAAKRAVAPMLAEKYRDHAEKVDWGTAYAQPKYDGNRMLARSDDNGITLWTRKGVQIHTFPHVIDALRSVIVSGTTWDGEAYVHGMHVTNLRSLMTRKQPGCEKVGFRVYDAMDRDSFGERFGYVRQLLKKHRNEIVTLTPTIRIMNEEDLMKFQRECIELGFEGAMLRWGNQGYEAGQRSQGLLKVKTFDDGEFKILDVIASKGTYNLTVGEGPDAVTTSVRVGVFCCKTKQGHPFTVTAPGTVAQKLHTLKYADEYIGKPVEIKHAGWTKTDKPVPFQPVAKQVRED